MASLQINFYIMPNEQEWFDELLRSSGSIRIVAGMTSAYRPQISSTTVLRAPGDEDLKVHLFRDQDLEGLHADEIPSRGEWIVDVLRSPAIEFRRCFTDGRLLRRGRLFFIEDYYDNSGRLVRKDVGFLRWARGIISKVRRSMIKREDGDYMSPGAAEQQRDDGLHLTAD